MAGEAKRIDALAGVTSSLTSRVGGKRSSRISSENQVKLERVYVRMPRHQEPTKDVAKLRKASGSRKQALIRGYPRFGNDTREPLVSGW